MSDSPSIKADSKNAAAEKNVPEKNRPVRSIKGLLALPNNDNRKIIFVAASLCLVCSVLVSVAAIQLRPLQEKNKMNARKLEILNAAGLLPLPSGENVESFFSERVNPRIVHLESGEYSDKFDSVNFDDRKIARDPATSSELGADQDIARINRRADYVQVYLIPALQKKDEKKDEKKIKSIVLPVHGYGLWSTMYGFLALSADTRTITGFTFYEQGETAGLGAEVSNPKWLAQFAGKDAIDMNGKPLIRVNKGPVNPGDKNAHYSVDGISGATLTSNGVTNLLHFWLDKTGFGPYLKKIRGQQQ
ncbi:Na(+)-translocating NADH-quinone reductase subunit C [hydrothermal vent metagenome]|uniref:Na(+)-translocating NADH-quinone reductase subunit C n=1 Tax=hydrothermal vent metagenome TaxID=652676 RepID=A0A3B0YBZ1_9ZZZZ